MKTIFALLLSITSFSFARGQSNLTGKVTDEKNEPAIAATVLLLKPDSSVVKSALTDNYGVYTFNAVEKGQYLISVAMIGYKRNYVSMKVNAIDFVVPSISLTPDAAMLKEVQVTGRKPFLEQRADKLVVNVAGNATAVGATALEVLQKVPGVLLSNDKVTVVGKGTPTIAVDGRPSEYTDVSQVLRDISAANIDKIEVVSNPGAKYDAAGGAVINIVLKKNADLGTNGSISLSSGMGIYDRTKNSVDRNFYRYNPSITLNHRAGKLNVFGNYGFFRRNQYDYSEFDRIVNSNRFFQSIYRPESADSHNFRVGADLYADKKNTFGVIFRGFTRAGLREGSTITDQLQASTGKALSSFAIINTTDRTWKNYSGNLNWKHNFDTAGRSLNVDLDYSWFKIKNDGAIIHRPESGTSYTNRQLVDNPVRFGVMKLDYSRPYKHSKLDLGAKISYATIDNYMLFSRNGVRDDNRSTDFKYTENINALYTSYTHKLEKWEIQAGLRTEQTVATGKSEGEKVLDRNYLQLFPSFFITRNISDKLAAVVQYSRRVNRPSYQQQNPFVEYLDSLSYLQGNPLLKPETADQYKLSITYQSQPVFSISYNRKRDVIFDNAPRQEGNVTYTTAENLASYNNFAAELNFPIQFGKRISGFGGNQMIYNHYKAEYLGDTFNRGKWNWLAYWQVAYKPADTWSFEISGFYLTRFLEEFIMIENLGSLDLGIQKSLWNNKAKLSLNCNDVLFSNKTKANISYQDINVSFRQLNETRNVRLGFTYNFGNRSLKGARDRSTASEAEENRVKGN